MSTKEQILEKIKNIEDPALLQEILDLIDFETGSKDEIVALSNEVKKGIEQGLEDIKQGRVISHDEANKLLNEWFQKRK